MPGVAIVDQMSRQVNAGPILVKRLPAGGRQDGLEFLGLNAATASYARGAEIYRQDAPARAYYRVLEGVVRRCLLLSDGRRQVAAFHWPGDVFGLDVDPSGSRAFGAEAVSAARLAVVARDAVEARGARDPQVGRALVELLSHDLARAGQRMVMLGRSSAAERISAFLTEMAGHANAHGLIDLPMSREDIADYLGLTVETVSRTISAMDLRGDIVLHSARRIEIGAGGLADGISHG